MSRSTDIDKSKLLCEWIELLAGADSLTDTVTIRYNAQNQNKGTSYTRPPAREDTYNLRPYVWLAQNRISVLAKSKKRTKTNTLVPNFAIQTSPRIQPNQTYLYFSFISKLIQINLNYFIPGKFIWILRKRSLEILGECPFVVVVSWGLQKSKIRINSLFLQRI